MKNLVIKLFISICTTSFVYIVGSSVLMLPVSYLLCLPLLFIMFWLGADVILTKRKLTVKQMKKYALSLMTVIALSIVICGVINCTGKSPEELAHELASGQIILSIKTFFNSLILS